MALMHREKVHSTPFQAVLAIAGGWWEKGSLSVCCVLHGSSLVVAFFTNIRAGNVWPNEPELRRYVAGQFPVPACYP